MNIGMDSWRADRSEDPSTLCPYAAKLQIRGVAENGVMRDPQDTAYNFRGNSSYCARFVLDTTTDP